MSAQPSPQTGDVGHLGRLLRAPTRPQTYRNLCYLLLMFPLGLGYFVLFSFVVPFGIGLTIVLVGIPILMLSLALAVTLAGLERTLVGSLLGVEIPLSPTESHDGLWNRAKHLVTDTRTWRSVAYLLSEFVYGTVVFSVLWWLVATAGSFLLAPFYYTRSPVAVFSPIPTRPFTLDILFGWDNLLVGLTTTFELGSWHVETLPGALLVAVLGALLFLCSVQLLNGLARLWGRYARIMLQD
ncbi:MULTISPECIES: sensor domain-containing protein [unclassified Haladaptatus]|uniref:sensor domain-containing protein n=1 Tax=unclassified Haladaptatus TaxID=2622732 RepID=UPI00209C68D1|nr:MULTISPECIES: sensor domain-containing protein [unclassified Haladaptatus]MCO8243077.1 sensor domain-containing protein [Haladaptatus sp. AB643]MCO8252791.1 sensor domain-containing protein [Haladaptatus sp. AB618]